MGIYKKNELIGYVNCKRINMRNNFNKDSNNYIELNYSIIERAIKYVIERYNRMSNEIIKARWLRFYSMPDEAVETLKRRSGDSLSVSISREVELGIADDTEQYTNIRLQVEGVELVEKISRQKYLEENLKMPPQRIDEFVTGVIKKVKPEASQDNINKSKNDYLNETINIGTPFYLIMDGTGKSIIVAADKALDMLLPKIAEKSGETPSSFELPNGPEFLLWLFYKYWNRLNIKGININNISSISNIEEHNHHTFNHKTYGEKERESIEVCFKILLNKAITSLKLQTVFNENYGNDIEIQIPNHKTPNSFRFSLYSSSPNANGLLSESSALKDDEQAMLKKGVGAYIFNAVILPPLISAYASEKEAWKEEKKNFISQMQEYANKSIGEIIDE